MRARVAARSESLMSGVGPIVMFVAGTRRPGIFKSSLVRTHAQSRAGIESSRARVPYTAGCEFSLATVMRIVALHSKLTRFLATYVAEALGTPRLPRQQAREAESHFVNWTGEQLLRPDFASRVVRQLPVSFASVTHAFHTSSE